MQPELKPFWNRIVNFDWKFGIFLILLICIPRFILVLKASETGSYSLIGIIMMFSALVPFLFLSKYGRKQIGIRKSKNIYSLIIALLTGVAGSLLLYYLGNGLYGNSFENWYVYIGKSYQIPEGISVSDKKILFAVMAITGMTFSPVGEEFFFRGIVHNSFAKSLGEKKASFIDSLAFALTHISHFGLVFINYQWDFYPVPGTIWVLCMFLISILFFIMKKFSDSIWGAVFCHSGFNFGMIYCIFYLI